MAKNTKVKGKIKKEVACCAPAACGEYIPRLYLDLQGQDVKQVKGLTVGEKVQILIEGTVKGLEQRENVNEKGKTKTTGSISLEGYEVTVLADEDNEFTKMAEEDEA